jgi:hypothetical protein
VEREKSFFVFLFFVQALEAAKSGLVLFHEAMEVLKQYKSIKFFERAAAKGHKESIWVLSVVKDVEPRWLAWKEGYAKTEEPLGCYCAGELSYERERFDFFKKSAEGGCSWGQTEYGMYLRLGDFVEKDEKVYAEWLKKAANQNNPRAMDLLGAWFLWGGGNDKEKAFSYYRAGAESDFKDSMVSLARMLRDGEGCAKDLRQAAMWSAKGLGSHVFLDVLYATRRALESEATEELGCDFNQLCYSLGWGLYWYQYDDTKECQYDDPQDVFENRCLDYYCSCVELQQESIFTFLLCWKRTTGIKGPGQMISQMIWDGRKDNPVQTFDQMGGEEPEMKQIKK